MTLDIDVTAVVPGADFDLFVYETDETGAERGAELGNSGNFGFCAQLCGTQADPAYTTSCDGTDECLTLTVETTEFSPDAYLRVEVVYFTTPAGYTANLALR